MLVAAGLGLRLGDGTVPKALRMLNGVPMYIHSIRALQASPSIDGIVLVCPRNWMECAGRYHVGEAKGAAVRTTFGGKTRTESVGAGLELVPADVERIVVHDAARPLVTSELFERVLAALDQADGAICAVPLADTLKEVRQGCVERTIPREHLWRAQTPQAFRATMLRLAHDSAGQESVDATDDATLVERVGGLVVVVEGDPNNIKITTPADLRLVEALQRI